MTFQKQVTDWYRAAGGHSNLSRAVARIEEELVELKEELDAGRHRANIGEELADVGICLLVAASIAEVNLQQEMYKKHLINLQRKWKVDSSGAVYHIKGTDPRGAKL